ncbi:Aldo/keto reductase [Thelephora ganbajun]|uniref:Aldo/keto reductase n=1 Tax=Thelephora ganbajun TaxID=370292 RepID=A0ACB6ZI72_THEGA|nr:Aldo/keto reductase [Thelephora ganbajun]
MTDHQPEIETFQLGPLTCPRLFTGLWQLSSVAWGSAPAFKVRKAIADHAENGYTAFADHYGSAEIMFGRAVKDVQSPINIIGATKWCVFRPTEVARPIVEEAVRERMDRMQSDHVDLLQFHWQDYSDPGYITALQLLQDLQREGLISTLGLCNFDTIRTDEICTTLGPRSIVSNQVQFSLIDTRPLHGMIDVCQKHDVKLLTYGTLCGGFLVDSWLGKPEPQLYDGSLTPSQRKYLDMILKAWGDWTLFQELLVVLRSIGDRHGGVSIANVATRWVLDQPAVGAVIIGVRMGIAEHKDDNKKVFSFSLTTEDNADVRSVLERSNGDKLIVTIGDCGAEYR